MRRKQSFGIDTLVRITAKDIKTVITLVLSFKS